MSTTSEQLAELIRANTALKSYIEEQYEADLDRYKDLAREGRWLATAAFHVDQINGDDANDGSADAPLKSLKEAENRAPVGGDLRIVLLSDYDLHESIYWDQGQITITGGPNKTPRKIKSARVDPNDLAHLPRFVTARNSVVGFNFNHIIFEMVEAAPEVVNPPNLIATHNLTSVLCRYCEWQVAAGANQAFLQRYGGVGLTLVNCTVPETMRGLWMEGVAAGTDPLAVKWLSHSNLSIL